jgi:hypothetical protein
MSISYDIFDKIPSRDHVYTEPQAIIAWHHPGRAIWMMQMTKAAFQVEPYFFK